MPRISGIYSLPPSYKATSGQNIRTEQHNPPMEDIAQALTDSLPRDGSAPMQGSLSMNGQRITGLAKATAASDALRKDQAIEYSAWLASVGALSMTSNKIAYSTGPKTSALTPLTSFARALLDDVSFAEMRVTLGLGDGATTDKATTPQAVSGSSDGVFMTPKTTKEAIEANTPSTSAGAVGTYAFLCSPTGAAFSFGSTFSGASLRPASIIADRLDSAASVVFATGPAVTGTWRCMGDRGGSGDYPATLFLRIS